MKQILIFIVSIYSFIQYIYCQEQNFQKVQCDQENNECNQIIQNKNDQNDDLNLDINNSNYQQQNTNNQQQNKIQSDLLLTEIDQLENTIKLYQTKVQLLHNLREQLQNSDFNNQIQQETINQLLSNVTDIHNSQHIINNYQHYQNINNQDQDILNDEYNQQIIDDDDQQDIQNLNIDNIQNIEQQENNNNQNTIDGENSQKNIQKQEEQIKIQKQTRQQQTNKQQKPQKQTNTQKETNKKQKQTVQQRQFMNKVLKKAQYHLNDTQIVQNQIINTFQYQTIHESTSNQMSVSISSDNLIYIHDITGYQIVDTYDPKQEIKLLTVNPRSDEVILATVGSDNYVKVAKIEKRKIKVNDTQVDPEIIQPKGKRGKPKERYRYTLKEEMVFPLDYGQFETHVQPLIDNLGDGEMTVLFKNDPEKRKIVYLKKQETQEIKDKKTQILTEYQYNTMSYVVLKGTKYFLLGDNDGNMHTYYRNGTFQSMEKVSNEPIQQIIKSPSSQPIFASKKNIGFFNPTIYQNKQSFCDIVNDGIQEIRFDLNFNNYLYVLTNKQEVIAYEVKNSDNSCNFKHIFDTNFKIGNKLQLLSIKNSLMVLDQESNNFKIFNTTEINQSDTYMGDTGYNLEISPRKFDQKSIVQYSVLKGTGLVSYLTFSETSEAQKESQVQIFEITTPQKKDTDFLNNLRYPILAVAFLGAIGYQYYNKKQKGGDSKGSKEDFSKIEQMLGKEFPGLAKDLKKERNKNSSSKDSKSKSDKKPKYSDDENDKTSTTSSKPRSILKNSNRDKDYGYDSSHSYESSSKSHKSYKEKKERDRDRESKSDKYKNYDDYNTSETSTTRKLKKEELNKLNKYKDAISNLNFKTQNLGKQLEKMEQNTDNITRLTQDRGNDEPSPKLRQKPPTKDIIINDGYDEIE